MLITLRNEGTSIRAVYSARGRIIEIQPGQTRVVNVTEAEALNLVARGTHSPLKVENPDEVVGSLAPTPHADYTITPPSTVTVTDEPDTARGLLELLARRGNTAAIHSDLNRRARILLGDDWNLGSNNPRKADVVALLTNHAESEQ